MRSQRSCHWISTSLWQSGWSGKPFLTFLSALVILFQYHLLWEIPFDEFPFDRWVNFTWKIKWSEFGMSSRRISRWDTGEQLRAPYRYPRSALKANLQHEVVGTWTSKLLFLLRQCFDRNNASSKILGSSPPFRGEQFSWNFIRWCHRAYSTVVQHFRKRSLKSSFRNIS